MDFDARWYAVDGTEQVVIAGELDLATAPLLEDVVGRASRDRVVIDAAGLTFVDIRGVAALVGCRRSLVERGGDLVVRSAPDCLRRSARSARRRVYDVALALLAGDPLP